MPVYFLDQTLAFPDPRLADPSGLLAVGGDLRPERLLLAYRLGIFPWPIGGMPLLWFSPPRRMVLRPEEIHISRSLKRVLNQERFEVTLDGAFDRVIAHCADPTLRSEQSTWITPEMQQAYVELHRLGYAHSCEAWLDGRLVGGIYGVSIGRTFSGESMFHLVSDASKVAMVALVSHLERRRFPLFDCQVYTDHVARFGAREWPRAHFLDALARAVEEPTLRGKWSFGPE
jgi:leucyl/phenylalanyl-tRNA--protein transferase